MRGHKPDVGIPLLILLVAWALLTVRLDAPWFGIAEENGAWISAAVRNYRLYGADNLWLMQVLNAGPATPETYHYYVHHPPLVVWSVGLAEAVFGFHEAVARWVMASATLISIAALYALARRLYDHRRAWWAMAFYAFTPMVLYFGRIPDHEPPTLAIVLLLAVVFVDWWRQPTRRRWWALAVLAVLAVWTSWAGMLYVGVFVLLGMWQGRGEQRRAMFALGAVAGLALVTMLGYYQWRWPDTLRDLLDVFVWRASSRTFRRGSASFTVGQYLSHQTLDLLRTMPTLLLVGLPGAIPAFRRDSLRAKAVLGALFVVGAGYLLLFRNAGYIHIYYKIFLAPPLALSAAVALYYGSRSLRLRQVIRVGLSVLVLSGMLIGAYALAQFHATGEQPYFIRDGEAVSLLELADAITAHTSPDDIILTDMPFVSASLEYYAFRDVTTWLVTPAAALTRAEQEDQAVVYIYCSDEAALPEEMTAYPVQAASGCLFMRLR